MESVCEPSGGVIACLRWTVYRASPRAEVGDMKWLGWILFGVMVIWYIRSMNFSHRKRLHLNYYIVYLLLDSIYHTKQSDDFRKWVRQAKVNAKDASVLSSSAYSTIENLADRLARGDPAEPTTSSVLGAHAMLWNFETEEHTE
jgi:hypothetical protein